MENGMDVDVDAAGNFESCHSSLLDSGSAQSQRYYLARKTLLQMFRGRGFAVPNSEIEVSFEDFRTKHGLRPCKKENPTSNSSSAHSNSHYSFSTPVSRTLSRPTPLVHHSPQMKGGSNHFVSPTPTTYGSLLLADPQNRSFSSPDFSNPSAQMRKIQDSGNSDDPLSPDSVINTWELMEGLDAEDFHFHMVEPPKKLGEFEMDADELAKSYEFVEHEHSVSKPLWKHLSAKMDTNVVSSFRNALMGKQNVCERPKEKVKSQKIESLESDNHNVSCVVADSDESCCLPGGKDRIVLYHTSMRGIRKTYDDCCAVRVILRCCKVRADERDIAMDMSYRTELQEVFNGKAVSLPQVFVKGKHIGGAEEIEQLHEAGELGKLLEGFQLSDHWIVCEACGDARFVPCRACRGSQKVYEEEEGKLRMCSDCNENGLVRCFGCCP